MVEQGNEFYYSSGFGERRGDVVWSRGVAGRGGYCQDVPRGIPPRRPPPVAGAPPWAAGGVKGCSGDSHVPGAVPGASEQRAGPVSGSCGGATDILQVIDRKVPLEVPPSSSRPRCVVCSGEGRNGDRRRFPHRTITLPYFPVSRGVMSDTWPSISRFPLSERGEQDLTVRFYRVNLFPMPEPEILHLRPNLAAK